jgi:hypothetical protein
MFPNRSDSIKFHRNNVFCAIEKRDFDQARFSFGAWIESLKQSNVNTGGTLNGAIQEAEFLFSDFVRKDPLYLRIAPIVIDTVKANPGILQTALYLALPDIPKQSLSYVLYFAADHGCILRKKKGRTYELFPILDVEIKEQYWPCPECNAFIKPTPDATVCCASCGTTFEVER